MTARENPARIDEVIGTVEFHDTAAVDREVRLAAAAQCRWADTPVAERVRAVRVAADALDPELDAIAELTARETGKVLADARGEAGFAAVVLRWYAERGEELLQDRVTDDERGRLVTRHRPFGVVGAITPWNAPLILSMLKVAPALVAGNAIVVKPSPLAPFGVTRMLQTLADALPAGLVRVVHGEVETATALVGHELVSRIAFTGGDVAGRAIASLAGRSLTPSVLELGGNDPAIVLPDADLDDAAMDRMVMAAFATSGQVCMALKRLYVPAERHDEIVAALVAAAERVLHVGDPLTPGVTMGPVVSAASAARVRHLVEAARSAGATVVEIGTVVGDLSRGHFVRPTLVLGVSDDDPVVATEQFGPTLPVLTYDSLDDAVARANAGELGLGASVWSSDEERAFEVAARLDAGFAFVNTHNRTGMTLRAPFGGVKRSGWGREYGDEGLLEYVQPCVIHAPGAFRAGAAGLAATAYPGG
ncbi:aldehyde dehydrogenase family protein [Aeromicrobium wangtongii]|uniref:aldehyde dehydrogenase family protein n=1 Tax=Aeromicrobium wangtongii TaxID=2969247 RepID=UPI002016B14E|nr:aldehyde dehydrogenase family protein [Aeromicrobium wangtongii]MCL3818694.1 aldehyde dehydrogenase family protein [Aeromicrobium wangtongii]